MSTILSGETDVLIIGAGHNGLVCAYYLAAKGLEVTILERRHVVGGAAVTEEFAPGFRNSTASYTVSLLQRKVIRDMRLYEHGLQVVLRNIDNFLPTEGPAYLLGGRGGPTKRGGARRRPPARAPPRPRAPRPRTPPLPRRPRPPIICGAAAAASPSGRSPATAPPTRTAM